MMNLKDILKSFKLNESTISMLLGAVVVAVVGILIVNYVRERDARQDILPEAEQTEQISDTEVSPNNIELDNVYVVSEGDSLWSIAERAYGTGDAWRVIADANNLSSSREIRIGQELQIPSSDISGNQIAQSDNLQTEITVSPIPTLFPVETFTATPMATLLPTTAPVATIAPTPLQTELPTVTQAPSETPQEVAISGERYTVQSGDTLWDIAQRAYGDPYKWTEIAEANNLVNPNLIHRGNEFVIPR
jgi:nucleoid-associated protein YgaU